MEAQFERLGLLAERVEAISPEEIVDTDRVKGYPWLDDQGIVCGLSHIRALRLFVKSEAPLALILEDDAVLSASLPEFLRLGDNGAIAADIVRVETQRAHLLLGERRTIGSDLSMFRNYSWCGGSAAYLLSRTAAMALAKGPWLRRQYADVALFDPCQPVSRRFDVWQLNPGLCDPGEPPLPHKRRDHRSRWKTDPDLADQDHPAGRHKC